MYYDLENSNVSPEIMSALKLLAHPIRFSIAYALKDNKTLNVGTIQEILDLPQSTVSQHISKMREARIVEAHREGTKIFYSLKNEYAKKIIAALD